MEQELVLVRPKVGALLDKIRYTHGAKVKHSRSKLGALNDASRCTRWAIVSALKVERRWTKDRKVVH